MAPGRSDQHPPSTCTSAPTARSAHPSMVSHDRRVRRDPAARSSSPERTSASSAANFQVRHRPAGRSDARARGSRRCGVVVGGEAVGARDDVVGEDGTAPNRKAVRASAHDAAGRATSRARAARWSASMTGASGAHRLEELRRRRLIAPRRGRPADADEVVQVRASAGRADRSRRRSRGGRRRRAGSRRRRPASGGRRCFGSSRVSTVTWPALAPTAVAAASISGVLH